jgi:hypothetical protein
VRQPLALLFLGLGVATTFSLVFAARRLGDDGSLSALDWFRLTIVGIIALAFFGRIVATLGRLPPIRQIRRALKRPPEPRPLATVPRLDGNFQQIGSNTTFSGSLIDTPPGTGNYQYWVIAANSDNVDTVRKDPSSGFFSSNGNCID